MDINSIQGMSAYAANALMAKTASVQSNNKEVTNAELYKEGTQTVQEAFQVDITQEALALQAENPEDLAQKDQEQLQPVQTQQTQGRQGIQLDVIA